VGLHDGNGWVACGCGARHWGLHGAAGLLLHRRGPDPSVDQVLLQLRAPWTHQGGTWALPGGAADSHEDAVAAALRETTEETGVPAAAVRVLGSVLTTDHGDWTYTTVIGSLTDPAVRPLAANEESVRLEWTPVEQVARLDLHPAFERAWADVRVRLAALVGGAHH
jgi:8-oxo-dGTP diphosphatase